MKKLFGTAFTQAERDGPLGAGKSLSEGLRSVSSNTCEHVPPCDRPDAGLPGRPYKDATLPLT